MADATAFTKLVPGFDFLQGLVKNAGAALPNMGQWIAPTLNPEELEKRIEELRTVQFWLEQNARMLGATIQALEVQRMTLTTLKTMNVQMNDLRDALKVPPMPAPAPAAAARFAAPENPDEESYDAEDDDDDDGAEGAAPPAAAAPGAVDPMQWWGALTKQFTELATTAMKDSATDAAKGLAGALMKQSVEAASETLKKAVTNPLAAAQKAASVATSVAVQAAGAATRAATPSRAAASAKRPVAKAAKAPAKRAGAGVARKKAR
jgi:hypothetical protein